MTHERENGLCDFKIIVYLCAITFKYKKTISIDERLIV